MKKIEKNVDNFDYRCYTLTVLKIKSITCLTLPKDEIQIVVADACRHSSCAA